MGATYTRQSSSAIVDGGVIEAADINAEFNQVLAAFAVTSGHTHDGTAAEGGPITKLLGTAITIGDATAGTDIAVTFDGQSADGVLTWMEDEDYFQFSDDLLLTTTERLQFRDTALYIHSSADGQLDIIADTEVQIAATTVDINGAVALDGAITGATNITLSGELDAATLDISGNADIDGILETDALSINSTTVTSTAAELNLIDGGATIGTTAVADADGILHNDGGAMKVTSAATFKTYFQEGISQAYDDFTIGDAAVLITTSSGNITIDAAANDSDIIFKGTDGGSDTTFLTIDGSAAGAATFNSDVVVGGDLTVTGDDITMATNTAGNLLVADGTNFNSIAVSSLSEIATAASDDIFLAIDTSGGGLKKIARSAVVAGLATDSAIANVVDDTSPQLGGNLDMNGADIITTSNATIDLAPNGTGTVVVRGNTNSGAIVFNCESNSHGQTVIAQPHSASVTNTMLLPAGASSTLVSLVSADTLTNKTLTSPKINENVAVTSTASELNALDGITAVVGELNALDIGSTAVGTAVASKAVILDSNKDYTGFRNITLSGELDAATLDISGAIDIAGASQFSGAVTVGVDDTGLDVKFFGASAGAYFEWDQSADQLRILGASADATTSTGKLLLATALTDINANDVMGKVDFQAPLEAGGTDAITIAASIQAVAQATFSSSVNATDLLFFTGHSEAATEKFRFTSQGEIGIAGNNVGTDGQVLTSGGAGAAAAWEDAAGAAAADDIAAGDAAVSIATSSGAVVVDSNASTVTIDGHTGVTIAASSSGNITLDSEVDISLDANGGDIFVKDAGTTFGSLTNTSGNLIIKSGTTTAATFSGANVTFAGTLASGAITASGDILPSADDAKDLGSASKQWRNIYTGDLHLSNKSKSEGNVVDGTTGDWTIQEGEENLYILNNKSGKKYKFNLTEV